MLRLRTALLAIIPLIAACKSDDPPPASKRRSDPLEHTAVTPATERDVRAVEPASYARTLEAQLDLVPPDADLYLVVRDLRPLIAQARRVEQVMAGPLARAIPALARLGGGSGEARLAQLARARELLALLLAGLEGSGVELDKGLVVVQGEGEPLILFAAADLQRLGALASLAGASVDLASSCGELGEQPGWFACSLGGAEPLASYRPAKQGAALARRLGDRLGGVELERVNVAISLAETGGSLDAVLRTDPALWELSMPVPLPAGQNLLAVGSAPALRALVPGTSFAWGRIDASALAGDQAPAGPVKPELLTGEFWFGVTDDPDGLVAQAGITDASEVAKSVQALAALLPSDPNDLIAPEQLGGVRVDLDRASIDLDGKLVPSIGLTLTGDEAQGWAEALGVSPRARLWAYGEYASVAVGEVQAIPAALGRLDGSGPPPAAIAALPPTLARSLLAGEVALVVHLVLDHWQAPPSEAELASLLAGVAPELRPDASGITALFQALAPWSSCDLWLRAHGQQWIANLSLVPFAVATGEVGHDEARAAAAVLDAVLAGGDGQAGYLELLAAHPRSPLAYAYRARAGDAPDHHATIGMVELGLIGALVIPALDQYISKARASEAVRETQAILGAALAVRERTGSCDALIDQGGEAGPTPPLSVACHEGDGGRCRPVTGQPAGPGEYPITAWSEDPIWSTIDYRPDRSGTGSHRYHYAFEGERTSDGCRLRVRAIGDLDGDGVLSTHEREATIGADGSQSISPMRVERADE
ncbi:MAG TPA: hypothetical protein VK034_02785 [Enhygromyxa sp.]|nr:hypothetical protein [Enhygromyxa sp.]